MATSQNGYTAFTHARTTGELPRLRRWVVPGTDRHLILRDGSVGFLLVHLALWFHQRVERLDVGVWDEWGWAFRPIRGTSSTLSNHSSGTAADLNATRHPLGVPIARTFTPRQVRMIRRRVRWLFRRLIVWGGDWNRPDGMHFELAAVELQRAERLARFLMRTPRGRRVLRANPDARAVILS